MHADACMLTHTQTNTQYTYKCVHRAAAAERAAAEAKEAEARAEVARLVQQVCPTLLAW